jgi:very-short-patch-repair endonuclease
VALVLAGLRPVPQFDVFEDSEWLGRVDLAFPEARIAIEYEGAYHFEDGQIIRDDVRYARLRAAGWTVIRLSAAHLRDLDTIVARVHAALEGPFWP